MSEEHIQQWRGYVQRRSVLASEDIAELEEHLRSQVDDLKALGLADDEAFLVAVKRMGRIDDLSREYAREHSDRLWKQLVIGSDDTGESGSGRRDLWVAIVLAVGAAVTLRTGLAWLDEDVSVRLASVLVLPWLAGFFAWKRGMARSAIAITAIGFVTFGVLLAVYPFDDDPGDTLVLASIHAPVFLWLLMGVAYVGGDWRSGRRRMDFVRFTGEWVVYYFLLAAGGGLLIGLTVGTFHAVGIDVEDVVTEWIMPFGAAGATVIAAWLVESKQNVIENIAPVLARVFSPLTILLLVALLIAFAADPDLIDVDRELLILMTVILVLVLALWLYAVSARPPQAPPGLGDWLQVALVVTAIVVDLVVLIAMAGRIAELGLTANRSAALCLNVVLLVNLAESARLGLAFVRGNRPVAVLERWQTAYLPVYAAWAAVVVIAWGPLFSWA